jgi:hypothetical protein
MFAKDLLLRIAEEEAEKLGGEIQWFPVDQPECAGGTPVPHVMIGGWSYEIPLKVCTDRERFRRWLQGCMNMQCNGHCSGSNGYRKTKNFPVQLELDL